MKRLMIISLALILFLAASSASTLAIQQAEIRPNKLDIGYSVQFREDNITGLNFEADMGLTETIGVQSILTYADTDDNEQFFWDNNIKFKVLDDNETKVSGLVGHHTDFESAEYPRFGFLVSSNLNRYLDLHAGADFLIDHEEKPLGFFVGFDYMISNNFDFELGYRQLSGQERQGFIIGIRHSL